MGLAPGTCDVIYRCFTAHVAKHTLVRFHTQHTLSSSSISLQLCQSSFSVNLKKFSLAISRVKCQTNEVVRGTALDVNGAISRP